MGVLVVLAMSALFLQVVTLLSRSPVTQMQFVHFPVHRTLTRTFPVLGLKAWPCHRKQ